MSELNQMAPSPDENRGGVIKYYNEKSRKMTQYLATLAACLGAASAGCSLGWSSPVLPQFKPEQNPPFSMSTEEITWASSILAIGALISAIPAGMSAEKFGRKNTILYLSILFIGSLSLIIIANNAFVIIVARLIVGFATGAACVVIPLYINELADAEIRGTLGSFFQMSLCLGIFITYSLGSIYNYVTLSYILAVIPILFVICFSTMPESPVYLLATGQREKAQTVLQWLRGNEYNIIPIIEEIQSDIDNNKSKDVNVIDLMKSKAFIKGFGVSLGLMFFQQFSGINAVMFYSKSIFEAVGGGLDPNLASILVALVQLVFAYAASLVIDKAGRRFYLMLSAGFMGLSLGGLGYFFYLQSINPNGVQSIAWLPLSSLVIYTIMFSLGFGPIPWMMTGELVPSEVKGVASGLSVMFNWFLVFLVTKYFPILADKLGNDCSFYFFMAICFVGVGFVYLFVPETKGKTLQEIQEELSR